MLSTGFFGSDDQFAESSLLLLLPLLPHLLRFLKVEKLMVRPSQVLMLVFRLELDVDVDVRCSVICFQNKLMLGAQHAITAQHSSITL